MSEDWAEKYIDTHKQKQQERQNKQRRADLAAAGAPDMFQSIKECVRRDLQTFHDAGVLQNLQMRDEAGKFEILSRAPYPDGPVAFLHVELSLILIKYLHSFASKAEGKALEEKPGALRICADLNGEMRVYRNGDAFADESEVSEFLLKPLLDYVDG